MVDVFPPVPLVFPVVYHAVYLGELTLLDLSEKIAVLYGVSPQQITHIYREKASGIHLLVSDEVSFLLLSTTNPSSLGGQACSSCSQTCL